MTCPPLNGSWCSEGGLEVDIKEYSRADAPFECMASMPITPARQPACSMTKPRSHGTRGLPPSQCIHAQYSRSSSLH